MSETRTLQLVTKLPEQMPVIGQVEYSFDKAQELVGGCLEAVTIYNGLPGVEGLTRDLTMWCNEEGKLDQLPANFPVPWGDMIVGPVFFSAIDDEGATASLTDDECKWVQDFLTHKCGICIGGANGVVVIQV